MFHTSHFSYLKVLLGAVWQRQLFNYKARHYVEKVFCILQGEALTQVVLGEVSVLMAETLFLVWSSLYPKGMVFTLAFHVQGQP